MMNSDSISADPGMGGFRRNRHRHLGVDYSSAHALLIYPEHSRLATQW